MLLNYVKAHPLQSLFSELQGASGAVGDIDDAAGDNRTTIINADRDSPSVVKVRHPHPATEGQGGMGGGHVVHVVGLAAGGVFAVEIASVPGGGANLVGLMFLLRRRPGRSSGGYSGLSRL